MRNPLFRTLIALALVLVLAPVAAVAAPDMGDEMKTELTGQLAQDDTGAYFLVEQESGETIRLESADDLSEHVGSTVEIEGEWIADADGQQVFRVSECSRTA